jgi:TolB-like protein/Tfp pilus assembly protein PilF
MNEFLQRLKQRKLVQWTAAYVAAAFALLQGIDIVAQRFGWPEQTMRFVIIALSVGFFITLVLAWYHGERGAQHVTGTELLIVAILLSLGGGFFWHFAHTAPKALAASAVLDSSSVPAKSVAVLPFVDMSQAKDQEYFSEGIAEELLNRLAQFSDLKVAARTSAFKFRGRNEDIPEIARQLRVANVLEGSVRKSGANLRITAQLIQASSGYHLWSQTFDRVASDIFKVQDEIAAAIADALETHLSGRAAESRPATIDPAAYNDYLQGRAHFARRIDDNLKLAVADFDRAIAHDPAFAAAYAGRAFALALSGTWVPWLSTEESLGQALLGANKALELDPNNPEAYVARAMARLPYMEVTAVGADYERALSLAPENVDVLNMYGDFLEATGNFRRAEKLKRRAMALDPLAFVHPMNLSDILADQGRFEEAMVMARRAVDLGEASQRSATSIFWMQVRLKKFDEAGRILLEICPGDNSSQRREMVSAPLNSCIFLKAGLLAATGRISEAAQVFSAMGSQPVTSVERYSSIADFCANELRDISQATAAAQQSLKLPNWNVTFPLQDGIRAARLPEEVSTDPAWLAVWSDPKLRDAMELYRTNLAAFRNGK